MVRALYRLLIAQWTLQALTALTLAICIAGSLMLPSHLAFFSGIDDTPLFVWLKEAGSPPVTWWIYAMVLSMGLLGLSTILCTLDSLIKASRRGDLLGKLYPQLIHIGVLLVLLGHLLTAWLGTKQDVLIKTGETHTLGSGAAITLKHVAPDAKHWEVALTVNEEGGTETPVSLMQMKPLSLQAETLFIKSVTLPPADSGKLPSALIRVCRDPGAWWALGGGVLVVAGGAGMLYTRRRGLT